MKMTMEQLVTVMCCHEAAHAVAAYRRRLPFHYVRFTMPEGGVVKETDVCVDNAGMQVAYPHLAHLGIDLTKYWGDYLSVLAIAKLVNQHHNHLPEDVAMGFAGNDFKVCCWSWVASASRA